MLEVAADLLPQTLTAHSRMAGSKPSPAFSIEHHPIGEGAPCFIIAEAGVNHNGSLELALRLVDAAREAGATAVKFQTFRAAELATPSCPKAVYQQQAGDNSVSQFDMIRGLELSAEDFERLFRHCQRTGILFLSTPFGYESVDLLVRLGVPALKISSGEITNLPLLEYIARQGKPVILSTGMSTLGEVETAVNSLLHGGAPALALLHCVSQYPTPPNEVNLRAMATLAAAFHLPVGFSDHTAGTEIAMAAVAVGASIVEKHFTLDRSLPGPDHRSSLEPTELSQLVTGIRKVEAALGDGRKLPAPAETDTLAVARRSLVARVPIARGTRVQSTMLTAKRPGTGLPPSFETHLVGREARVDIPQDTVISLDMFQ